MTVEPCIRKALRIIILAQCAGALIRLLFSNGFMLAYLSQMGVPSYRILFLLSLISLGGLIFTLPSAYLSDRFGKKRIGTGGLIVSVLGLLLLIAAGSFDMRGAKIATTGIMVTSLGVTAFSASWFALLSPIVPEEIRGRFFGKLRISWQAMGIVFTLIVTALLKIFTQICFFQYVLWFVLAAALLRIYLYQKLPELEREPSTSRNVKNSFVKILRTPGYLPFCAYTFLLSLFTGSIPWILGLLGKDILFFSNAQILLLGNLGAAGAIAGFYAGGKMVDHLGTKPVFLICHISFSVVLFLTVLRGLSPFSDLVTLCMLSTGFGAALAASGIAFTSELLAIIPPENKSLSTGFHISLSSAGIALSSLFIGQAIKLNMLNSEWTLLGQTVCEYDTILLGSAVMILLLLITVGLIPSVIQVRKSQWYPHTR